MPSAEDLKAAIQSRDAEKVRALLREDPSLAACRLPDGGTPALLAIYYGAADVLEALVARGVKLDVFEASAAGETSRVRLLVDADPTLISQRSHDGWTPLHLAAHFGRVETMRMLIEHGADVHARSSNEMSNTPLHAAAAGGRVEAVAELLGRRADPEARQHGGWTALHAAAQSGRIELARLLLDRGADASARTDDGITPLDLAEEKGRSDVAALLRERGAEEGEGG
jgi:ankyrin repeat protein